MGQVIRQADVRVRAEGMDGYTVVYSPPVGEPRILRVFPLSKDGYEGPSVSFTAGARLTRQAADAYRDGVDEGLRLAADALDAILRGTP